MHYLTGFQRDCLYIVAGYDGAKGLAIKDELDEYYENEINHGRLYPNFDSLVEKGLVEKGLIEKGRRDDRTNSYALTQRGVRELEARRLWENQHAAALSG